MNSRLNFAAVLALGLNLAAPGIAGADDSDPPARVARLDLVEGSAALQPAGSSAWLEDLVNRPLSSGDKLMCDSGSRAELHVGSTAIRIGEETALQIVNIGDQIIQLGLSSGTMILRVRRLGTNETIEVDTPNVAVTVLAPGDYRIDVDASAEVVDVAVVSGYAEVTGQTQDFTLNSQQQGEFSGGETLAVNFGDLAPAAALAEWSASRDATEDDLLSSNYVSPEATGYQDLDENGTWQEAPDYGMVWQPQVSIAWVPYQVGRWEWIRPWGWTWIDAAAWGYAPFHYGRWVYVNSAWCWAPGNPGLPQVYAPALVAWLGGPGIAWVALADKEPYQPPYHASAPYIRRLNAASGSASAPGAAAPGRAPHFVNQAIPGAVSAVALETFASGRPLNSSLLHLDAHDTSGLPGSPAAAPPAPAQSALRGPNPMRAALARSSAALFAHALVARTGARRTAMSGPSPPPINLVPAQAVALHARREAGFVAGRSAPSTPAGGSVSESPAGAAARGERSGNAGQSENRSKARVPVAAPAAAQNSGAEPVAQKSAPKAAAAPKDPRKAKPEPR